MSIADTLLPEFEQEMTATRRVIERVPDDKPDWTKCSSIRLGEKRSWPAATGVCVVNTVRPATRRMASSIVVPSRVML
jgi:hypothetical protein